VLTCVASVICRRLAAGPSVHPVRLPPPHWRTVRRLARAWRGGGALQDAPSCADGAPHPRLDTGLASSGASGRTVLRHGAVRLQACEPAEQQPGRAWLALTCCTRGKSHPPNRATHRQQCKCQRSRQGTFFLVRTLRVRPGCRFSRSCQQLRPGTGARSRPRTWPSCCCVAVFCCCTSPVNSRIRVSNLSV